MLLAVVPSPKSQTIEYSLGLLVVIKLYSRLFATSVNEAVATHSTTVTFKLYSSTQFGLIILDTVNTAV